MLFNLFYFLPLLPVVKWEGILMKMITDDNNDNFILQNYNIVIDVAEYRVFFALMSQ